LEKWKVGSENGLTPNCVLYCCAAQALIPDDDDEELVDLAKSRRKERLATEKTIENKFVKQGDYRGRDVSKIQNAVNKLAKEGLSLESGDLQGLANASRCDITISRIHLLQKEIPGAVSDEISVLHGPLVLYLLGCQA